MPKIEDLPSLGLKGVKGVKGVEKGVKKTESHFKDLNKLTEDKEFKMCNSALKKLEKMEGDQDEDEWVNFVERKGEDMIVKSLKARANISKVWNGVCGGDGNANIEMYKGIEFVLQHFMPTSAKEAKDLAYKFPNVAFRVIADDTSPASLKVRALLAADHENENAFKLKMREWYDDHQIDVASQATFDYIGWHGD
jgi:hypothetical protein